MFFNEKNFNEKCEIHREFPHQEEVFWRGMHSTVQLFKCISKRSNCLLSIVRNTDTYCTHTYLIIKLLDSLCQVFCTLKTLPNFQAFKA